MSYPFKLNGYIYSPKTKAGFLRMKRMGIPRPLFSIQDRLQRVLFVRYKVLIRKLLKDLKKQLVQNNITLDSAPEDDSLEALMKFFEEEGKKLAEENEKMIGRINLNTIANTLETQWLQEEHPEETGQFVQTVENIFKTEQEDYLGRLFEDADDKTRKLIISYSIDKEKFFEQNLENIRRLYLNNSLERIKGEEDYIKRKILGRIIDYAEGRSDKLKLDDVSKEAYETGQNITRLFARDQMQRFNKACTLSTFQNAGVTKVKWVTSNDGRVRKSHKELNGKIFDVRNLPPEVDDYNCRCGLVPVEWSSD